MSKTTVDLDERLLERARKAIGARTMRETLDAALRSLIGHAETEQLRRELGTFDLDLSHDALMRSRRGR
jgi:Arc/MetJ family transcription regulator